MSKYEELKKEWRIYEEQIARQDRHNRYWLSGPGPDEEPEEEEDLLKAATKLPTSLEEAMEKIEDAKINRNKRAGKGIM